MDMNKEQQIKIDDITFDDVIGGEGVEVQDIETSEEPKKEAESVESVELDSDIEEKEDEVVEENVVEEEDEKVVEEEEEEEDSDTIVNEVIKQLGVKLDGKYDDTTDGLVKLSKDVGEKLAEERLDEMFEAFPLVQQHLEYVLNGGDSQQFMRAYDPTTDFDKLDIPEENVRLQKSILTDYFTVKGHDKEFISELLEDYEDTGKLFKKSEAAKDALSKVQKDQRAKMLVEQKEQTLQKQKEQTDFWTSIYDTIDKSKEFVGLQIADREKKKFFNYISKPVQDGYTQRDIDHAQAEVDVKLAIDYLMFKGFKLDEIINKKARTKSARSLKDSIIRNEETIKSARKASKRSKSFDIDDLDLSI